jgi:pimeloyl-ACP methyl ester carboxylesterase
MSDLVVLLPGIMGSVLEKNRKDVWQLSISAIFHFVAGGRDLHELAIEQDSDTKSLDDGVVPAGLIRDATIVPGLFKIDGYSEFAAQVPALLKCDARDCVVFPYDWRRDNRYSARQLHAFIDARLKARPADAKVTLVCHSMGGLVARYYVEVLGGWKMCRQLVTIATPHRGSVCALQTLCNGVDKKLGPIMVYDLTKTIRTFTSLYQLLPIYPCVEFDGKSFRASELRLPGLDPAKAMAALAFHREIEGNVAENQRDPQYWKEFGATYPVVGTCQPTLQSAKFDGTQLTFVGTLEGSNMDGDGTVPRISATPIEMSDRPREAYAAGVHGWLQKTGSVLEQVRGIFTRDPNLARFRGPYNASLGLAMEDAYEAEEPIQIRVRPTSEPVSLTAVVTPKDPTRKPAQIPLRPDGTGWHAATLPPQVPGIYRLRIHGRNAEPIESAFAVLAPVNGPVAFARPAKPVLAPQPLSVNVVAPAFEIIMGDMAPVTQPISGEDERAAEVSVIARGPSGGEGQVGKLRSPNNLMPAEEQTRYPGIESDVAVLQPDQQVRITIKLAREKQPDTLGEVAALHLEESQKSLHVDVRVDCPQIDFGGQNCATMKVQRDQDAQMVFEGRVRSTAGLFDAAEVQVVFYLGTRMCGSARRQLAIGRPFQDQAAVASSDSPVALDPNAPQPKLTVEIRVDDQNPCRLIWITRAVGLNPDDFTEGEESVYLEAERGKLMESLFAGLQDFGENPALRALESIGDNLYQRAPASFKRAYAQACPAHADRSRLPIQFITNDPFIPWELMRIDDPSGAYHLCVEHPVARWRLDRVSWMMPKLPHGSIVAIAPHYDPLHLLPAAQDEVKQLVEFHAAATIDPADSSGMLSLLGGNTGVLKPATKQPIAMLHFAGHADFDSQATIFSKLLLQDSELLVTDVDRASTRLGSQGTVVFLNACKAGRTGTALGLVSGWADAFLKQRFRGFIAPLWAVSDDGAYQFTGEFYDLVFTSHLSVSDALRAMRKRRRSATWMSYVYYGDVMAKFQ